ncbi:winged helix-turn-helix domain-containing protein [Massilia sp. TN1-12]|uniref:winged helix-turn-helix domain-containing protein n=1 Tax=Massilia paldalensis TaxID=3377675 RepID=UPI00384DF394
MSEPILSPAGARALHLAAQGMLQARRARATKDDVLAAIRRMGVLQIDTISVVARSPYLVLWSRLGDYDPAWLDALLAEGRLFEYWAHEACFIPIEDYGLYRHRMIDPGALGWKYAGAWMREHPDEVERVLEHIREHGPARSADFERSDGQAGGWWQWKPEKRALEVLFTAGVLMIARRHNFHRIYDLAERVLPGWDDARMPSLADTQRTFVLRATRALGVAKAAWTPDYHRTRPPRVAPGALADAGLLLRARVEGWKEPVFVHPDHAALLEQAAQDRLVPTLTTVLSPFDPIVWDRRRAQELFGFDYRLESYTPADKRRYGYFCLPLLRKGRLVGRIDAKAQRKAGVFEVKALILEPGVRASDGLLRDLATAIERCARWHGCAQVTLAHAVPDGVAAPLRAAFDRVAGAVA